MWGRGSAYVGPMPQDAGDEGYFQGEGHEGQVPRKIPRGNGSGNW
jgi:hypothetical protein